MRRTTCRVIAAVLAVTALTASASPAATLTGISDQQLGTWSTATRAKFSETGLTQARYITAWDVALHKENKDCGPANINCLRLHEFQDWYNDARNAQMKMLVSFEETPSCNGCAHPSSATYRAAVHAFRVDFPEVTEFTAWNEPNRVRPGSPPQAIGAAHYWNELNAECKIPVAGKTCMVAAGDLIDSGTYRQYTDEYKASLNATPTVWAIHPYRSVDKFTFEAILDWVKNYTQNRTVWYSEFGSFYCTPSNIAPGGLEGAIPAQALEYQDTHAAVLKELLRVSPERVHRAYYYFFAKNDDHEEVCPGFDTALIGANSVARPAFRTLFPQARLLSTDPLQSLNPGA